MLAFSVLKKTFGLDYILTFSATAKSLAALPPLYRQEHYAEPITLKGIAEVLHYSANYLGRAFYAEERMRYSDYLHQIRIQYASELLLASSLTPTLIAEKVGYKDITYFHKMFRQITGTTPRAYRASSKQDESSKNA